MSLLKLINQEKEEFETQDILIVDGLSFNQKKKIEMIYFYHGSKFKSGEIDTDGDKKYFYNINRNPCKVTTKSIDFDQKHISILTAAGGNPLQTWYFERDLKFWMKDKNFGKVLNRIFEELPIFGSVVIKVIKGTPYFVDLRNFIIEQSADTLDGANYIIEKHLYTPMELRKAGKEFGWENVEDAIEQHRAKKKPYIAVYERYGEVSKPNVDGTFNYVYERVFVADVGEDTISSQLGAAVTHPGVLLKEDKIDKHPYWEFHLEKIPGRWLGVGIVEILEDPQIRVNELANQEAKGTYWASLRIWQTIGEGPGVNLNTDVVQGQILETESAINKVDVSETNLSYFQTQTDKWEKNRDEVTFSYDVVRGERLPAGTPLGSARLAAAMAGSHFDQIQENIALDIKEFIYEAIIPQMQKENSIEHVLRLVGEDLDKVQNLIIKQKAIAALYNFIVRKRKLPTRVQYEAIKTAISERVKRGKELLLKIPKEYYKDIKFKIDILITGEQKDIRVKAAALFAAIQAVTADPALLTDPAKKKFFDRWLENNGLSPVDFQVETAPISIEKLTEGMPVPTKGAGGGVSRPALSAGPEMGKTERTI